MPLGLNYSVVLTILDPPLRVVRIPFCFGCLVARSATFYLSLLSSLRVEVKVIWVVR
jgi:hypothetical protein